MNDFKNLVNKLEAISESMSNIDTEGLIALEEGIKKLEKPTSEDDTP